MFLELRDSTIVHYKTSKRLEALRLQSIGSGRANKILQQIGITCVYCRRNQQALRSQRRDRALGLAPTRVLHQNGADHDLERGFSRPPGLRAVLR
jgi:hypothetical protein